MNKIKGLVLILSFCVLGFSERTFGGGIHCDGGPPCLPCVPNQHCHTGVQSVEVESANISEAAHTSGILFHNTAAGEQFCCTRMCGPREGSFCRYIPASQVCNRGPQMCK